MQHNSEERSVLLSFYLVKMSEKMTVAASQFQTSWVWKYWNTNEKSLLYSFIQKWRYSARILDSPVQLCQSGNMVEQLWMSPQTFLGVGRLQKAAQKYYPHLEMRPKRQHAYFSHVLRHPHRDLETHLQIACTLTFLDSASSLLELPHIL